MAFPCLRSVAAISVVAHRWPAWPLAGRRVPWNCGTGNWKPRADRRGAGADSRAERAPTGDTRTRVNDGGVPRMQWMWIG